MSEYRVILESDEVQANTYGVDMDVSWIRRIILNPWLPERQADSIKASVADIEGCSDLEVEHSQLINSAQWKRAGGRIAGKEESVQRTLHPSSLKRKSK